MNIKNFLKTISFKTSTLANELNLSRPTLDKYILMFDKGQKIPNETYQKIFENLFLDNNINLLTFAQNLSFVKKYILPENIMANNNILQTVISENSVFIVSHNTDSIIYKLLSYRFQQSGIAFYSFIYKNSILESYETQTKLNIMQCIKKYSPMLVIFDNCFDDEFLKILPPNKIVIIGNKNKANVFTIKNVALAEQKLLTSHGLEIYFNSCICNNLFNILQNILEQKFTMPLIFDFNNISSVDSLIYKFPTMSKSYSYLIKRFKESSNKNTIIYVAAFNSVEFLDSNYEIDYVTYFLQAIEKGVNFKLVYVIKDKEHFQSLLKHYCFQSVISSAINKSIEVYVINFDKLTNDEQIALNEGYIIYDKNSVYHDDITEYSLGYVDANIEHISQFINLSNNIIGKSKRIKSMEELYE